ncbi:hypothetical protein ONE63_001497 [Megalurothrips usitatus]|uniref:Bestrophin homolog n=1 Tax=Megalurothrips usitatus TaxID=439358 RepID=A0AAV7XIU4_9NEOP|nr:hypothetical protein ONE63_001497 [Megalurothrips usitatus]
MTVTYTAEVATSSGLGCFLKLLFRWRGSIYKLLWPNLALYSFLYFSLSVYYRFVLSPADREWFERLSIHCQTYGNLIPVSFVLGFYVSLVIKRWWDQYVSIPWPDNLALFVSALVHGQDERGRLMRRTVMRYVNLSLVLTLRMVSPRVKMRFPTMEHLVEAGLLQPTERKIFEDLERKTNHPKYWLPLVWASGVLTRARKEGRVTNDFSLKTLIDELNIFRAGCGKLLSFDWISIPLVYTQVVTLAVHFYFIATLMGNQYLDVAKGYAKHQIDLVVPFFTFLEFFFYMGWLKVAESLVNPFGEDDDDFEVMWLIDRNLQMSYVIVDEMHEEHPEMLRDAYWDEVFPAELPYTAATKQFQTEPPQGSTKNVEVPVHMADFVKDVAQANDGEEKEAAVGDASDAPWAGGMVRMRRVSSASVSLHSAQSARRSRTSMLSVLARAFHRDGGGRDSQASGRSSGVSLLSRAGAALAGHGAGAAPAPGLSARAPASRGSSRTTLVGSDFQEDVFRLSDVSLAGQGAAAAASAFQVSACAAGDRPSRGAGLRGGSACPPGAPWGPAGLCLPSSAAAARRP